MYLNNNSVSRARCSWILACTWRVLFVEKPPGIKLNYTEMSIIRSKAEFVSHGDCLWDSTGFGVPDTMNTCLCSGNPLSARLIFLTRRPRRRLQDSFYTRVNEVELMMMMMMMGVN